LIGFVVYTACVFYSAGTVADRVASVMLLIIIMARRLEGVSRDLEWGPFVQVVLNLLLFQRRPERPGTARESEGHDA
jgi:hypothetical protein